MKIEQIHNLFLQCNTACTDTRKIQKNDMFFALKGDNFNGNTYAKDALKSGAKYAIIDEADYNETNCILVGNVLETLQKLATYHRNYHKKPIIALTGSNGKTTTKELINSVLSKKYKTTATVGNLNNHIGVPLTLLAITETTEIAVIEIGANHQKEIEFLCDIAQPDYGYITNFGKAHLEGFGGVEGVIKGKSEMYDYLIVYNKTIFVNGSDPIQVEKTKHANTFTFSTDRNSNLKVVFKEAQPFVKCLYNNLEIESKLIGDYNFSNIAVAIAIGNYFKVNDDAIKTAIESYTPSNNRSQIIQRDSNKIILDAYNANPTSMMAALLNFEKLPNKNKIAFLGDMFELGQAAEEEHQKILDLATSLNIHQIILIGANFYKTKNISGTAMKFKSFEAFKNNFALSKIKNATLLIKGSRGMALERILELL